MPSQVDPEVKLAELRKRLDSLKENHIRITSSRDAAANELNQLKAEARQMFGTDDLEQLRAKLQATRHKNTQALAEFEASLNSAEKQLASARHSNSPSL